MSLLSNWRLREDEWVAVYEPADHYRVRIIEECKNDIPYWTVQLFREGEYRRTVAAAPTRIEACVRMVLWLDTYPIILTDKKYDNKTSP